MFAGSTPVLGTKHKPEYANPAERPSSKGGGCGFDSLFGHNTGKSADMAKRSYDEYAEMSAAVEAGEYTVSGPVEMGRMLRKGRLIGSGRDGARPRQPEDHERMNR